jgi:hypothetical protein
MWPKPQLGLESEDKQSVLVTQDGKGSNGLESEDKEQSVLVTQDSKGSTTAGSHTAASYFESPRSVTRHQSLSIIVPQIHSTAT